MQKFNLFSLIVMITLLGCEDTTITPQITTIKSAQDEIYESSCSDSILIYTEKPTNPSINIYWRDENNIPFRYFYDLEIWLNKKGKQVVYMTNAGMYTQTYSPLGLLIQNGTVIKKINRYKNSTGNFYIQPNGVFYITYDGKANIVSTNNYIYTENIRIATQSGPLLVLDGKVTSNVQNSKTSEIIRNGVGILPNGNIIFIVAIKEVSMLQFANIFKQYNCITALNLDGGMADCYYPEKGKLHGTKEFGPIICITK